MQTKYFEMRSPGTCVPLIATRVMTVSYNMLSDEVSERVYKLLKRAGYGQGSQNLVLITFLIGSVKAEYDPYKWPTNDMRIAHIYIEENWDSLKTGDLIDVEKILGKLPLGTDLK